VKLTVTEQQISPGAQQPAPQHVEEGAHMPAPGGGLQGG
jgi:hypothetical protein